MTPEQLRLLRLFGSAPLPSPKANEVPFPMGDPRMEEERKRLEQQNLAERAASRKAFKDAPIDEQIKAIVKGAGFMGATMLEDTLAPFGFKVGRPMVQEQTFPSLRADLSPPSLAQPFEPKTPAEQTVLTEIGEYADPVVQFMDRSKVIDLAPGIFTAPEQLIRAGARQAGAAAMKGAAQAGQAAKKGVKAAGRAASSTEDMLRQKLGAPVGSIQLTQSQPTQNPLGFYSALDRATDSLQNKGTGQQFLNQLTNMQGVKADEIKWTGLDEFLKGKKDVTKQEVKDYLNANQVKLEEVRLGEMSPEQSAALAQAKNRYREITDLVADTRQKVEEGVLSSQEGRAILEPLSAERSRLDNQILTGGATPTKFRSYSTRGGKNYRELLLTLPFEKTSPRFNDIVKQYAEEFKVPEELAREELTTYVVAPEETSRFPKYEKLLSESGVINQFESSHFDQPNILAHMRVSDFEQDGKKIMLVDEVQSDWHQTARDKRQEKIDQIMEQTGVDEETASAQVGRDVGYMSTTGRSIKDIENEAAQVNRERSRLLDEAAALPDSRMDEFVAMNERIRELTVRARELGDEFDAAHKPKGAVPDAPFKTTWHELALRRAVREASEKGFDKIAIPTGSVQNDRYKLSKYLSAIDYRKNNDGTYGVIGIDLNGNAVVNENRLSAAKLKKTVGKEMAKRIADGVGEPFEKGSTAAKEGYKKISGIDLEVGGEGMKGFYDQMVPKYLNKLGSKFGTKVTRGTIKDANGKDVPVHELTITPQMRKSVLEQGQPLFAAVPAVGLTQEEEGYASGGAIKKAGKAAKKASKATDLEAEYSQLKAALEQVREGGRTPVVPAPNRWFMNPEKFPGPQGMIERALANVNQERSAFGSGAYINPVTGEILDSAVMENLLVAIDPKTGRPMMSGRMTDLEELEKSLGSQTLSNLVRKGLFKHSGGDPILADLPFIATIEKGPHFYGLSTEYASPAMLFNTGKGDNPTLRPKSRGSLFAVGDEVGEVQLQGRPHPVYEKLMVAPVGSDVQGKLLKKAGGGAIKNIAKKAVKAAAESAGIKNPIMGDKDLMTLQDTHTSLGDAVRFRAAEANKMMEGFDYKYDKGQRVFTKDSAAKNRPPLTIVARTRVGNQVMREEPGNMLSRKMIDPATGRAKRTPYEPGYRVRQEDGDDWFEYDIPASAIIGDVEMAGGGSIRKAAKAAKAASKASETKEQPIYWGMYRGYAGDDVSATEPQFAAMDKKVAEYYAKKRAAQTGLPPHLEMIYKQLEAGRKYGHTVPMDEHNRELLITQAYELQPEEIKGRYQLKKRGGRVKGNI